MILTGLKYDLAGHSDNNIKGLLVSRADVEAVGRDIGAACCVECSALTQDGLKCVFDEAVRAALTNRDRKKNKSICSLL